jgi:hypothetical protein
MRKVSIVALLFALCACAGTKPAQGHGAISVEVVQDPITASYGDNDNSVRFPIELVVREKAGRPMQIARVSVQVKGTKYPIGGARWDADAIRGQGGQTFIPANGEVRLKLFPVRSKVLERDFHDVNAEIIVQAFDETNTEAQAWTSVAVIRRN